MAVVNPISAVKAPSAALTHLCSDSSEALTEGRLVACVAVTAGQADAICNLPPQSLWTNVDLALPAENSDQNLPSVEGAVPVASLPCVANMGTTGPRRLYSPYPGSGFSADASPKDT